MNTMTAEDVVSIAREYLANFRMGTRTISFDVAVDKREGDFWYVTVRPDKEPSNDLSYYDKLAKLETKLRKEKGVELLFVPVLPD